MMPITFMLRCSQVARAPRSPERSLEEVAPHHVGSQADEDEREDVDAHAERQPVLVLDVDALDFLRVLDLRVLDRPTDGLFDHGLGRCLVEVVCLLGYAIPPRVTANETLAVDHDDPRPSVSFLIHWSHPLTGPL